MSRLRKIYKNEETWDCIEELLNSGNIFDVNKKKGKANDDLNIDNIDESLNTENTLTTTTSKNKNINIKIENNKTQNTNINNNVKKEETIKIINHGQFVEKERNNITIDIDENELDKMYENMFETDIENGNFVEDPDVLMKKSDEEMKFYDENVNIDNN